MAADAPETQALDGRKGGRGHGDVVPYVGLWDSSGPGVNPLVSRVCWPSGLGAIRWPELGQVREGVFYNGDPLSCVVSCVLEGVLLGSGSWEDGSHWGSKGMTTRGGQEG